MSDGATRHSWFQRFLLPGFAFKAVVIGGGYATGREIAEFFLPAGPWGGLFAMVVAMLLWSGIAAITFAFAHATHTRDYRSFFKALLGRAWFVFDLAYAVFVVLILAVFGAAAGAIGAAAFGLPPLVGTVALMAGIAACVAFGNRSVERAFAWISILLYGVYAIFFVLALTRFGDRIATTFAAAGPPESGWLSGGIAYASYNIIGAVVVLPVTRHLTSRRDAVVAGLVSGPLAMLPALLFFLCMTAFSAEVAGAALPSDYLLTRLGSPAFHILFQLMIFAALLESGSGAVHAINERIAGVAHAAGRPLGVVARALIALALLAFCMLLADRFGLVALIASGYRALAWTLLAVFVVPLLLIAPARLLKAPREPAPEVA
ncbi:hypothetical protein [Sphingomonas sp.]|uniref:YkvI family membrane protein n=1 Tax=Sphingomonas sp. TaxID=28214 RepID=UPI001B06784E|nr:hypothetical protein [Sphingomonas sp.]MBO9711623.1 hypothetical protein [Sphingomonas sp.]